MPLRPKTTRACCTSAAVVALMLPACSSSQQRDQWYGTDAGLGYVTPDAPPRADLTPDLAPDSPDAEAIDGAGAVDESADSLAGEGG